MTCSNGCRSSNIYIEYTEHASVQIHRYENSFSHFGFVRMLSKVHFNWFVKNVFIQYFLSHFSNTRHRHSQFTYKMSEAKKKLLTSLTLSSRFLKDGAQVINFGEKSSLLECNHIRRNTTKKKCHNRGVLQSKVRLPIRFINSETNLNYKLPSLSDIMHIKGLTKLRLNKFHLLGIKLFHIVG